jgi:hypothetical protein
MEMHNALDRERLYNASPRFKRETPVDRERRNKVSLPKKFD